jgi:hypothetical protein
VDPHHVDVDLDAGPDSTYIYHPDVDRMLIQILIVI